MGILIEGGIEIGGLILIGGEAAPVDYNYITDDSGALLTGQTDTDFLTQE